MLMRFIGGGIGHRGTVIHEKPLREDNVDTSEPAEDETANNSLEEDGAVPPMDASQTFAEALRMDLTEDLEAVNGSAAPHVEYDEGEEDYGYEVSDAESEEGEEVVPSGQDEDRDIPLYDTMDDLGAEDGEEIGDIDEEMEGTEGYAPL